MGQSGDSASRGGGNLFVPPAPVPPAPVPPAPVAPARDPSVLTMAFRMWRSQIEGWPCALYEAESWKAPDGTLFVMTPAAVRAVLQEQADAFTTGALFRRMFRPAWGRGMLTALGDDWRVQRRAASGAFRPIDMAKLAPLFAEAAARTVLRWRDHPPARVDMLKEMTRLTLDVMLDTVLSGASDVDRREGAHLLDRLFARINRVRVSALLMPDRYHERRPSARAPERAPLLTMIRRLIDRRRAEPSQKGDLLGLMMLARDPETGQGLDDELIADNLLGFMLAGHETTTLALTWALFLAASHPPTLQSLRQEVLAVAGTAPIAAEHVPQLIFARQVIAEALRLYPPGFMLTRVASVDTLVAGHRVRAGQRVNIPVYAMHRRADQFDNPNAFDPRRFAPDRAQPERYAYFPFGAGPRICLGAAFAMTEAVVVLATIVRAVDLTPPPSSAVWPVARLSLRPGGGMPMGVR